MKYSLILILFCAILLLVVPVFVQADGGTKIITIPNPLQFDSLDEILCAITELLKLVALGIGVIMVIYSGILIMTGMTTGEKESKVNKGKKTLTWTVIGVAIVFGVDFIVGFALELLGGPVPPICQ